MKRALPLFVIGLGAAALVVVMVLTLSEKPGELGPAPPAPPAPESAPDRGPYPNPADGDPGSGDEDPPALGRGAIEGYVRDRESGLPVADASVLASRSKWRAEVRSGAAGEFRFEDVPAGTVRMRVATADRVDPPVRSVGVEDGRTVRIDFELESGATIVGQVKDEETGDLIADALVGIFGANRKSVPAGADGGFRLAGVAPGRATLFASAPAYPEARFTLEVPAGESEIRQDVALKKGARVRGTVREAGGAGIPDAKVTLRGFPASEANTAADGSFELPAVPVDRAVWITAEKEGYLDARSGELRFGRGEEFDGLDLVLTRGGTVRGRVRLQDGSPASGVTVWLVPRGSPRFTGRPPRMTTAADGTFSLAPVAPGEHQLVASRKDTLQARVDVKGVTEGGLVSGVEVVLGAGLTLAGVVQDDDGKALPGVIVTARPLDVSGAARWGNARTDEKGRFRLTALVAGSYELSARPARGGRGSTPLTAPAGATDVVLRLPVPGAISGTVTDASGRPVTTFTIRARVTDSRVGGGIVHERVNSADGRFRIEGLSPGTYVVEVTATAGYGEPVPGISVVAGGEVGGIAIVLQAPGRIIGRVTAEDGSPAVGARVAASGDRRGIGAAGGAGQVNDRGEFEILNLRPGTYRVTASEGGLIATAEDVEVVSGSESRVDLYFPKAGGLTIRVASAEGGAVAGAAVQVRTAGGAWVPVRVPDIDESVPPDRRASLRREAMQAAVRTDARGVCVREGVPAGDLVVRVVASGYEDAEATVNAAPGRMTEARVVMRPGESSRDDKLRSNLPERVR